MIIRKGMTGLDVLVRVANKHGVTRALPISTDQEGRTINIPATSDITPDAARAFARAIVLAAELADGEIELA